MMNKLSQSRHNSQDERGSCVWSLTLQQGLNKARKLDQWPRADHMESTVSRARVRMAGATIVSQICTDAPKGESCGQNKVDRRCGSNREGDCRVVRDVCASS